MSRVDKMMLQESKTLRLRYLDLEKQIWKELSFFLDSKYLKQCLKVNFKDLKIRPERIENKANDIKYCIRQAKDYFESAKISSLITKPLLIYYGLMSLAIALLIFKNQDKVLDSISQSHGLQVDNYPILCQVSRKKIMDIEANLNKKGTFFDIANLHFFERFNLSVKGTENIENASKTYKKAISFNETYPNCTKVKLRDIFANITEIYKEVNLVHAIPGKVCLASPISYQRDAQQDDTLILRVSKEFYTQDKLKENFSILENCVSYAETDDYWFYKSEQKTNLSINDLPLIKNSILNETFIVADKGNDLIASDLIIYYLVFFIFGSIARYKPSLWRIILEDPVHSLGTIPESLCEIAYTKLPLLILSEFNDVYLKL
ncbi:MAG: YaaC family protein [Microcoleus sp.]